MLSTKCFRELFLFVLFCGNKQSHRLKQNWSIFSHSSLTFLFTRLAVFPLDCFFFLFHFGSREGRGAQHLCSISSLVNIYILQILYYIFITFFIIFQFLTFVLCFSTCFYHQYVFQCPQWNAIGRCHFVCC